MPKKGQAFPTSGEWKKAVRDRMAELGMEQKELARKVGCTQSSLSAILSPKSQQSALVPLVHKYLGWNEPMAAPLPSSDAGEMAYLFDRLPEDVRRLLLDQARTWLRRDK